MRTPLNLSLEIEIVNGLKKYSADHGVSLTSVLQEIICQFLGLKGLLDPVLKAAVEERIERRAGRPVDVAKKAEREKRAAEEQARVYREAGVTGPTTEPTEDEGPNEEELASNIPASNILPGDDPAPGPPIFNPEEYPVDKTYVGPAPICLRCMEVVGKCQCTEGPDEG